MRIKHIKLRNFIGIDQGVGLSEVEVNFDDNDNIILLRGANGSGKSTLLSQLHPYKQTFDERRYIIAPGKEGLKEITIQNGPDLYEIRHIYTPKKDGKHTTASFIQKNGVELNDSGLDSTFEMVIKEEFDITPDYFQIGKIGSNTKLFTDKSVGERKNFICTFLNMEELTIKYKIIETKIKAMKKDISLIQANINKYKDSDTLMTTIDEMEKFIRAAEVEIKDRYKLAGNLASKFAAADTERQKYNQADLEFELVSIDKKLETYKDAILKTRQQFGDGLDLIQLTAHQTELTDKFTHLTEQCASLKTLRDAKAEEKNKLALQLEKLNDEIKGLLADVDIDALTILITDLESKLDSLKIEEQMVPLISQTNIKTQLENLEELVSFVQSQLPSMLRHKFVRAEDIVSGALQNKLQELRTQNNTRKAEAIRQMGELSAKISAIQASGERTEELLQLRPRTCVDDTCSFIKEALKNKAEMQQLNALNEAYMAAKDVGHKAEDIDEKISELELQQSEFTRIYAAINTSDLYKYWKTVAGELTQLDATTTQQYFNRFIDFKAQLSEAIENIGLRQHLTEQLSQTRELRDKEAEKVKMVEERFIKDRDTVAKNLTEVTDAFQQYSTDYTNALTEKTTTADTLTNLRESIEALSQKRVLDDRKKEINQNLSRLAELERACVDATTEIETNQNRIHELESGVSTKKTELDSYRVELATVTDLQKTLTTINEQYVPMQQIFEALSPSKGIPLILMQVYLNATEAVTNELLQIAFGDKFRIKFVTNEKEFFIRVLQADGSEKEDVKYVSQGEKSIIETSLALALITQMMTEYNIISIDEIDGPLDPDNRKQFVEILRSQMKRLGSEQFFIISHNEEFDDDGIATVAFKKGSITYHTGNVGK